VLATSKQNIPLDSRSASPWGTNTSDAEVEAVALFAIKAEVFGDAFVGPGTIGRGLIEQLRAVL
jgi:hypothetical protein